MEHPHYLIVGGTSGAGREMVRLAAHRGGRVSVMGRKSPRSEDRVSAEVLYWQAELTDTAGLAPVLDEIVQQRGRVDALVFFQRFRGTQDAWKGELDTTLNATRVVIEHLRDAFAPSGGAITVIGSVAGRLIASEQPLSYHIGKAGLEQLVRYYAVVLGPLGIRVNAVSPSTILKDESRQFYLDNPQLVELYKEITPLRRLCTSRDVAETVAFLSSPAAGFITGQNILLDGGISLQWQEALARRLSPLKDLRVTRDTHEVKK